MFPILGFMVVIGAVVGGFLMSGGQMLVLVQPSEFVVIGGAALGSMLIANSPRNLAAMFKQIGKVTSKGPTKKDYLDLLTMMYEILNLARRDGLMGLESHVETPKESALFKKYPQVVRNHHAMTFLTDTLRLIISDANLAANDLDDLMDVDLETSHEEHSKPSKILQVVGDALPGLGIVAAVLGIVITMGHIDGPPAEVGHHVGAALVGTFLGVLLAYGFCQPLSSNLGAKAEEEQRYLLAMKQVLLAFHKGSMPATAVEFARRSILSAQRPDFSELEKACSASRSAAK
jgi:chemotaxis protein MotA